MNKVTIFLATLLSVSYGAARAEEPISFNRDVRPILSDRCFKCHGPDANNQDSEFRLDTREHALKDLGGYAGVVPGNLKKSELHARIHGDNEGEKMPPPDQLRGLAEDERKMLDRWILEGANYEGHWAFQPLPTETSLPNVESEWTRNAIDQFVLAALTKKGLEPNRSAPREKWLRRVTFDLTGLPPTLNEIDAFLADASSDAYEKVVDRLLDSDANAERLTSEWLDVARYSDSYGYQRDDERFVWPWRDWVIESFRENMPYDQFLTWQLAGDLLPNATREQTLATTFNRLHSHKKEGGVALEEFRVENVADRTHTVASAFMGLTLECCRCHDHKYDPITTKEYYQLSSFFANVDERGLISYFTDAVPTPAMPLSSKQQDSELVEAKERVEKATLAYERSRVEADKEFASWLDSWKAISQRPDENKSEIANQRERDPKTLATAPTLARTAHGTEPRFELPGLVASLSFEELLPATKEESENEEGKAVSAETMRAIVSGIDDKPRAITLASNQLVEGKIGQGIQLTGDDAVVLPAAGHFARHQPFSVSLWMNASEVNERAVIYRRSRGWDDAGTIGYELTKEADKLSAKLVHFWPGNAICVETTGPLVADRWYHVVVTYDGSSSAAGLHIYVNGKPAETTVVHDHLTRTITEWRNGYYDLAIGSRYRDRGFKNGKVDEFRVFDRSLAPVEARHLFDGVTLSQLQRKPHDNLTADEEQQLNEYFIAAEHEASRTARASLAEARKLQNAVMDSIPAITIMREQSIPRTAFVLKRGAYDQHGDQVTANTPAFLPRFPDDAPRNRLGLARWLTSADHPLTARVTVNRYWQMIFGTGLVRTPEDFGNQSEPPTHPELLDWLARDFVDGGWDVRRLLRTVVLSATYRQSAVVSLERRLQDPENRWYSRGPDQRLSAEMIRDNALAASGLLVTKVGGPPVKPYDVALAYTPLPVDEGEKLYRRSLYTFWKRTSPSPVMMTMNASQREVCRLRREVTNSPLQALVLLNGPQFTEAATALAKELLQRHGDCTDAAIEEAFRRLSSRRPIELERDILRALFEEQLAEYEAQPKLANQMPGVSEAAKEINVEPARLAAMTILVNSIFNLDECVRHQ